MISQEKKYFKLEICLVALLMAIHFLFAFTSLIRESATFDEPVYITGGLCFWKFDDYRINPENGNLPQRLAAIPLLFLKRINLPGYMKNTSIEANEFSTGYDFLYNKGNDPDMIFIFGKTMIVLLSLILGIVVYLWSRKLFGLWGALFSLTLYAFCPTVLAHARLVTSDIAAALGFITSVWAIWHMLQKVTLPRLLLSSLCLSLLFLSKMSAPLIIPMYLIMIAVRLKRGTKLELLILGRSYVLKTQDSQLFAFLLAGVINVMVIAFFIWMSFGFRYSMFNDDTGKREIIEQKWQSISMDTSLPVKIIAFSRKHQLLPEAYLFGFQFVLKNSAYRYAYLNGEYSITGWLYFFPYACLVKTPLPLFGIFLIVFLLSFKKIRKLPSESIMEKLYPYIPLVALISVYGIFAVTSNINIGNRHVLLFYPVAYILVGEGGAILKKASIYLRIAIGFFLLWFIAESLSIWPHYLAYFNQFVGGPKSAYKHMVDSSLDWGQDLKGLGKWLKNKGLLNQKEKEVYISYFGIADIDYYVPGIKILPSYYYFGHAGNLPFELKGGIYCISVTMLKLVYLPTFLEVDNPKGRDIDEALYGEVSSRIPKLFNSLENPLKYNELISEEGIEYWRNYYRLYNSMRFAKLAKYLEKRVPDDNIGYSILIYKLDDAEVAAAIKAKP